jgi:signal transduction histidine kinase
VRASRERLVLAAAADRRAIERDLHSGVQHQLVGLAVNLQLAGELAESDPAAAKGLLGELGRDVQQAIDETAQLAQRIYPTLVDTRGLAAALRAAAESADVRASVEVARGAAYPPEVAATVYFCWLDALVGGATAIGVRDENDAVAFEISGAAACSEGLDRLRDRVEALGGRLAIRTEPGPGIRVSGRLPLAR